VARYSVWAHLRRLERQGAAATTNRDDVAANWTTVK
jgi:hypothetical protein